MTTSDIIIQQLIIGLSNGLIIALIALGYTMVYGIVELINFAHGEVFMLGAFLALTLLGCLGLESLMAVPMLMLVSAIFCAALNVSIEKVAYRPLYGGNKLSPLVSAIGMSFILLNIGFFWGALPMEVFGFGNAPAAPKYFPALTGDANLLGDESIVFFGMRDFLAWAVPLPLLVIFTFFVTKTKMGTAMRAVAQNRDAAALMGISPQLITSLAFALGGALAGCASVIYALYNNNVSFQMGYRVGIDAFTAAVLGGIGNLPGAVLGGLMIGLTRSFSDQYLATEWTNTIVFLILILTMLLKPGGLLGSPVKEKV